MGYRFLEGGAPGEAKGEALAEKSLGGIGTRSTAAIQMRCAAFCRHGRCGGLGLVSDVLGAQAFRRSWDRQGGYAVSDQR